MSERNLRKTRVGVVSSDKMDKTVVVSIKDKVRHPLYNKIINRTVKYKAHDEKNEAKVGDRVEIAMTRPLSKTKAYTLVKIIERSHGTVELKEDVNKAYEAEKIGADEIAKAEAAEKEAKAEAEGEEA